MFDRSPILRVRPGRVIAARSVNGLGDAAARQARERPGAGLQAIDTPAGRLDHQAGPATYHARLAGSAPPYSFAEVYGIPTPALWADYPGGRTGSLAYPLRTTAGLGGQVVRLHPVGAGAWHWFTWSSKHVGGGGYPPFPGGCFGCPITEAPLTCSLVWLVAIYGPPTVTTMDTLTYGPYDLQHGGTAVGFSSPWAPNPSYLSSSGGATECPYYRLVGCIGIQFAADATGTPCTNPPWLDQIGMAPFCSTLPHAGLPSTFVINCSPFSVAWDNGPCGWICPTAFAPIYIESGVITQ
jgi:hypothetical protein